MELHTRKTPSNDPFMGMELGDRVKDRLTGFTGVVTAKVQYISGCDQMLVLPEADNANKLNSSEWFDVERLEKVEHSVVKVKLIGQHGGRDLPHPPARRI